MIGTAAHEAPNCCACNDTGFVADSRSADEDGAPDLLPCPRCGADKKESES
jgi:hypothetical protein